MKASFETRVSCMGLGSFVGINIFVMKYYLILVSNNIKNYLPLDEFLPRFHFEP